MTLHATYGLGSRLRVASLAVRDNKDLIWHVNKHCPIEHDEIFPHGIDGIKITKETSTLLVSYQRPPVISCVEAFRHVWDSTQIPHHPPKQLGIAFRQFHYAQNNPQIFLSSILPFVNDTTGPIALLLDSFRDVLTNQFSARCIPQETPELKFDLDRNALHVKQYLNDLSVFLPSELIISNTPTLSVNWLHAAYQRAF